MSEDEFKIRQAFVADPGYIMGAVDFSQLELFILAHVSGDEVMIDAFNNDKDLHLIAVHHIFGYDYDTCVAAKKKEKKVARLYRIGTNANTRVTECCV